MLCKYFFLTVTCCSLCVQCLFSNLTRLHQEFPSIREGDPCVKGKMYKMSCNTCHCAANNALYCTKMACFENKDISHYNLKKKYNSPKILRNAEDTRDNKEEPYLPELPKESCVAGKLYREGCRKCYCDKAGKPVCNLSKVTGCAKLPKLLDISSPVDVSPPITDERLWRLPILPHSASKCVPGTLYMVDCNTCLCMDNGNLLCETLLCVTQDEENFEQAKKWSGATCKHAEDTTSTRCIRCDCDKGLTRCHSIPGCVMPKKLQLHGNTKMRLNLNLKKEKCEPGTVYKTDCNHCFCQSDKSLRCTQKTCLSYRQTLKLRKQRSYLEKHGL